MGMGESIVVRCGRCGRPVRVSLAWFLKRRTFDCQRCLATGKNRPEAGGGGAGGEATGDAGTGDLLPDLAKHLTRRELSILLRRALGFSDEEIMRAYGADSEELRELMLRAAKLVRGPR